MRPLPGTLDEPHPLANVLILPREPSPSFREHLRGGVEDGYFVTLSGEWDRLLARATSDVDDAGRRRREVFGDPAIDKLVADYLAQNTARGVVALGQVGEGVFQQVYFPFLRYLSNSPKGRQLITFSFSTHARLACETPYFM